MTEDHREQFLENSKQASNSKLTRMSAGLIELPSLAQGGQQRGAISLTHFVEQLDCILRLASPTLALHKQWLVLFP